MKINLNEIDSCTDFFTREDIKDEVIEEYSELIADGVEFPPIKVFKDEKTQKYTKIDGFHAYHAALKAGLDSIDIEVIDKKSELDRFIEGLKNNAKHGLPLTSKDRRKNIVRILSNKDGWDWSDAHISKIVGTSDRTVANVRKTLTPKFSGSDNTRKYVDEDGEVRTIDISKSKTHKQDNSPGLSQIANKIIEDAQKSAEQNVPAQEFEESELSQDQRLGLLEPMKELQKQCLEYSKSFSSVNDRKEPVSKNSLIKLESMLTDLQKQAMKLAKLLREIKESI